MWRIKKDKRTGDKRANAIDPINNYISKQHYANGVERYA